MMNKRQAILDAARRAFLNQGYSGTSMEAIAEAAPVSKPTLYSHFHSKHELFAAVIADLRASLTAAMDQVHTERMDPITGLKAIASAFVELIYSPEALGFYRLLIAEQQNFPELGPAAYRASAEPVLSQLSDWLTGLRAQGLLQIDRVDVSSRLLVGMLKGDAHFRCLMGLQTGLSAEEKQELVENAVGLFLRGHGHAS